MTVDLARNRRELGASLEEVAAYSGASVSDLAQWERSASVPRKQAAKVRWALWALGRDQALAASGLPECDRLPLLPTPSDEASLREFDRHLETCETCLNRSRYLTEHVEPMPPMDGSLLFRVIALIERFKGWQRSAASGAAVILAMGGVGVVVFVVMGLVAGDLAIAAVGIALLFVLVLSGATGGVAHYLTRGMRARGRLGHYASCVIATYAYLVAVMGMAFIGAAFVGWEVIGADFRAMMTTSLGWLMLALVGAFFGLVFGHTSRH